MDGLCLKTGIVGLASSIPVGGGSLDVRAQVGKSKVAAAPQKTGSSSSSSSSRFSFRYPLQSLWPRVGGGSKKHNGLALDYSVFVENNGEAGGVVVEGENRNMGPSNSEGQNGNWVLKILRVRSRWREEEKQGKSKGVALEKEGDNDNDNDDDDSMINGGYNNDLVDDDDDGDDVCRVDDDEEEVEFDRDSFSRMLRRVSITEARLYAQMSYLGNLAYSISRTKPGDILRIRGLRFVISSVEKKELAMKADKNQVSTENQEAESKPKDEASGEVRKSSGYRISASAAYHIAASAASYLHSHTSNILPFKSSKAGGSENMPEMGNGSADSVKLMNSEMANFMATTDSVTAVVAAKEEVKQAVADDLSSTRSSPCEWFVCDDDQSGTRFFVIQGSESLASWQANLLFEPVDFESLDVLVHRGIYEAANGIYKQMLPEVRSHLKSHGSRATFRFTGHSLGGSLSLLINLMLLVRGEVPASSLLPVITFGAPSIMCGGDHLLRKLGLPRSHVQAITMHRDIVPRAFSCNYPNHVAELLKAVNGNFRNHPCLNEQKLLYAPMGELLILQPDEKFSPHHPLLPSGSGLYFLSCPVSDISDAEKQLRAAQMVFLNSPHPLEILSERSAYGSEGAIQRDHDMNSYLKSVRNVIRQELNRIRKAKREHRRKVWWPLVGPRGISSGMVPARLMASIQFGKDQFNLSAVVQTGTESLKRFSRFVVSQRMHLLLVLLLPAKLLLLGAYSVMSFR
ncbi:Lipase_3 domain-containing protein [Cephalotus follicularis]|uniref:Lipase_3 domain-containing protein n=1 Tax=Cephalotus follicularis TaxID=3775 RepID=A0A1Q3CR10_CEPFO|nr:Lipase_3 domain-containing protein [Cephalotus follicularis]